MLYAISIVCCNTSSYYIIFIYLLTNLSKDLYFFVISNNKCYYYYSLYVVVHVTCNYMQTIWIKQYHWYFLNYGVICMLTFPKFFYKLYIISILFIKNKYIFFVNKFEVWLSYLPPTYESILSPSPIAKFKVWQGSILGQFLFSIYIRDLPRSMDVFVLIAYAFHSSFFVFLRHKS